VDDEDIPLSKMSLKKPSEKPASKPKTPVTNTKYSVNPKNKLFSVCSSINISKLDDFSYLEKVVCEIRSLIENGESVNDVDSDKNTVLMKVIKDKQDNFHIIRELLDGGADVNARNAKGQTALHIANRVDTVRLLLKYGAKSIEDNLGQSPLDLAKKNDLKEIVKLLKKEEKEEEKKDINIKRVEEVPGLFYIPNIIDADQSQNVIDKLNSDGVWTSVTDSDNSREVQQYGYKYDYKTRTVAEKINPIPDFLIGLRDQLQTLSGELNLLPKSFVFNQCIVNKYDQGQGIGAHVDLKTYGPVIGCYTLANGAIMRFRNKEDKKKVDIYVQPNSLYIMSGDARNEWTHEMPATKTDVLDGKKQNRGQRISVTFRNVPKK
jgi:alkylated DNA repair dioxygenase AlkB